MFQTALYHSDRQSAEALCLQLEELGLKRDEITVFTTLTELKEALDHGRWFELWLVALEGDGLEAARLTLKAEDVTLIVLSQTDAHAMEAYRMKAARYLLYPVAEEELREAVEHGRELSTLRRVRRGKRFSFRTQAGMVSIACDRVVYVELWRRSMQIHLVDGTVLQSLSLRASFEMEAGELLRSAEFSQIHKSYIVSLRHIESMGQDVLFMDNGDDIPVSKRRKSAFFRDYQDYQALGNRY